MLLAGRSDLGRLVSFNQRRSVDPEAVAAYVEQLERAADADGALVIENPRQDEERIRLAIAERAGACTVEPAPGARLRVHLSGALDRGRAVAACRVAKDRGWRAYRAVEAFSFSTTCRRRSLLDHFGDRQRGRPEGRCCDVCDPDGWLPSPETIQIRPARAGRAAAPAPELSAADAGLLAALRAWRLEAAAGKPAYTVAHNRTLEAIAASRPDGVEALTEIHGVGPAFVSRHAGEVLRIVADQAAASPGLALGP